jgi:hypothetical protein
MGTPSSSVANRNIVLDETDTAFGKKSLKFTDVSHILGAIQISVLKAGKIIFKFFK